jgi:hypothetical protein
MIKAPGKQNEIDLRCRALTPMPGRDERGPLVANDHGICIVTRRRRLGRARLTYYYFCAWSDVIGYRLSPHAQPQRGANLTTPAHDSALTIYTRRDQYSWELPFSEAKVKILLDRWLVRIPLLA